MTLRPKDILDLAQTWVRFGEVSKRLHFVPRGFEGLKTVEDPGDQRGPGNIW
jgi:hypothetical protein